MKIYAGLSEEVIYVLHIFQGRQIKPIQCSEYFSTKFKSSHRRCSLKKVFLEISQNSQENTCATVHFFNKVAGLLLKKRLWHRRFPVSFVKFLRTPFLQNTSGRLLLKVRNCNFVTLF